MWPCVRVIVCVCVRASSRSILFSRHCAPLRPEEEIQRREIRPTPRAPHTSTGERSTSPHTLLRQGGAHAVGASLLIFTGGGRQGGRDRGRYARRCGWARVCVCVLAGRGFLAGGACVHAPALHVFVSSRQEASTGEGGGELSGAVVGERAPPETSGGAPARRGLSLRARGAPPPSFCSLPPSLLHLALLACLFPRAEYFVYFFARGKLHTRKPHTKSESSPASPLCVCYFPSPAHSPPPHANHAHPALSLCM